MGLIAKADFGAAFIAILWPIVIAFGIALSILLIGLTFGWVLMWPTISVQGTEPFDAMSSSYSYTYHRPMRYFFYAIVALVIGAFFFYFVQLFAHGIVSLGYWGLSWGAGAERVASLNTPSAATDSSVLGFAKSLIHFWRYMVGLAVMGYAVSYFWTSATSIYLLLRKDEDGAEIDEIFLDVDPPQHGLPTLKTDAAGYQALWTTIRRFPKMARLLDPDSVFVKLNTKHNRILAQHGDCCWFLKKSRAIFATDIAFINFCN